MHPLDNHREPRVRRLELIQCINRSNPKTKLPNHRRQDRQSHDLVRHVHARRGRRDRGRRQRSDRETCQQLDMTVQTDRVANPVLLVPHNEDRHWEDHSPADKHADSVPLVGRPWRVGQVARVGARVEVDLVVPM
jgi:hypothetical protein